jgi:hypothetical protein
LACGQGGLRLLHWVPVFNNAMTRGTHDDGTTPGSTKNAPPGIQCHLHTCAAASYGPNDTIISPKTQGGCSIQVLGNHHHTCRLARHSRACRTVGSKAGSTPTWAGARSSSPRCAGAGSSIALDRVARQRMHSSCTRGVECVSISRKSREMQGPTSPCNALHTIGERPSPRKCKQPYLPLS